ncbi:putative protein phosphatase 2C 50, partial [Trifolium medium]|nr:putative protein phosphatase 2C 50 [Trifolium medium]
YLKPLIISDPEVQFISCAKRGQISHFGLSNHALQKGSKDNITVIVVDLRPQRKFKNKRK